MLESALGRPHRPRPLWFWNGPLDKAATRLAIKEMQELCGYGGFAILPAHGMTPSFMSPQFLSHYAVAVDAAAERGMKVCLYDEYWFPSGGAGGLLAATYPEALSRRLEFDAFEVRGPFRLNRPLKAGTVLSAVALHRETFQRFEISASVSDGRIDYQVPAGPWRVCIAICVTDGRDGLVDYLDPARVQRFVELTYGRYFSALGHHFGTTIDSAFYDEPTLFRVMGNGMWTESFNAEFVRRRGIDARPLYPALLFDIGPDTAWARNLLLRTRGEMFSDAFVGTLARWCDGHGIALTGHYDQEEVINPANVSGDLIRGFEHQHIPGVDQIFEYGRASAAYKIVSSAATLYGRDRVMVECYGGIKDMPTENLYREAIDLFAKGVNLMVPHAIWYDPGNVIFEPELSHRTELYATALPGYSAFIERLHEAFENTQLVADIGLLYPIQSLRADFTFGPLDVYLGGNTPVEADYQDVGELLSREVRRDFLFVHPELLERQARVGDGELYLTGTSLASGLRLLLLPGGRTIGADVLEIALAFVRAGGKLVATNCLPVHNANPGGDETIQRLVRGLFGPTDRGTTFVGGGESVFLPHADRATLAELLNRMLPTPDVSIAGVPVALAERPAPEGSVMYCHRKAATHELYFFSNSTPEAVELSVAIRGKYALDAVDPLDGSSRRLGDTSPHDPSITRFTMRLPPNGCRIVSGR